MRRRPRPRSLQRQLFAWFLAAIVLAVAASALATWLTQTDAPDAPHLVASRHVQHRLARAWDDPAATEAYVAELRDATGLDVRVRRDPSMFETGRRRGRPGGIVFDGSTAYVPVVRRGVVVGALEVQVSGASPRPWRLGLALFVALSVLAVGARRVSSRIARPLESVAKTAERFGGGDLDARTGIERVPRRWVGEEVVELARAFDEMAARVGRTVRDQRELLAAISHELRSPMARSRVALEIARDRLPEEAPARRSIDDVERHLGEVDAILSDLLMSSRAGLGDLRTARVELGGFLARRVAEERDALGVEIRLDAAIGASVDLDVPMFQRALHNVLANAMAHGHPADAPLVVRTVPGDGEIAVEIEDAGPGFPEALLPRVFEPFVKGDGRARTPGAGTGLGLALVARILEAHGGRAEASNRQGGGARVRLVLPLP